MTRSILLSLAAAVALATTPSLAASGENWEQAARAYAAYAFSGVENWEQASRAYAAYAFGNPAAPGASAGVDAVATGSIVDGALRVDVQAFCEGEGKMLAERLYVGFCHLGR